MWERVVFRGSTTPLPQGGGAPALPKFWGFLSIYAYTHCRRTTKFDVVTHLGVSWGQSCLTSQESSVSALPILGLHPYLWICAYVL